MGRDEHQNARSGRAQAARLVAAACVLCLSTSGLLAGQDPVPQTPISPPPVTQTPLQPSFAEWLAAFRTEAAAKGISEPTLDAALSNLTPDPVVLDKDRTQPELTQTLDAYIAARLTAKTMTAAAAMMKVQAPLLDRIERAYGVAPGVMIAVWGLESNFGQITGNRPLIASLATLAYERPAASTASAPNSSRRSGSSTGSSFASKISKAPGRAPWGSRSSCRRAI